MKPVGMLILIAVAVAFAQHDGLLIGDPISYSVKLPPCDSVGVAETQSEFVRVLPFNSKQAASGGLFTFQAAVYDTGEQTIPPLGLVIFRGVVPAETVWTESRVVTISSSLDDTTTTPRPLKPYAEHPLRFSDLWSAGWPWLSAALVVAALILAWRKWFRKKPDSAVTFTIPALPPADLAIRELIALRDKAYPQRGMLKEHFSDWSEIMRRYVEGRYEFAALEMTTFDLQREFQRADLPPCFHAELLPLLREADMVKFAKEIPGLERCKEIIEIGFRIVETTKPRVEVDQESKAA